jgi:magnesium transporter
MVLHFPLFDARQRLTRPSQVAVFAGPTYIVSVHSGDLRPLTKLFQDVSASDEIRQSVMGHGSGYLLYTVLDRLVDYCGPILNKLISNVDSVETQVLDRKGDVLQELAVVRRDILSYRRVVRPQIQVLETLESKEFPFLKLESGVYFGDLADHMRRIWVELEELKEVSEGLQETHAAVTSQHTNEVIRVLTVFASIMLPLTVITGLYGMNVGLPGQSSAFAFLSVVGGMTALTVGMLGFFWKRGWL